MCIVDQNVYFFFFAIKVIGNLLFLSYFYLNSELFYLSISSLPCSNDDLSNFPDLNEP